MDLYFTHNIINTLEHTDWIRNLNGINSCSCIHYSWLLLLLSCFSHVWLCATPEMAAHQAPLPWDSPGKNTGVGCHFLLQCMKMKSESKVTQSCPTLSDPMDCSPPGSSIHGIFQARVLECGAIAFSVCQVRWSLLIYQRTTEPQPGSRPSAQLWQCDSGGLSVTVLNHLLYR